MNNILFITIVSALTTIFIFLLELFTVNIGENFIPALTPILNQENFLFLFFYLFTCSIFFTILFLCKNTIEENSTKLQKRVQYTSVLAISGIISLLLCCPLIINYFISKIVSFLNPLYIDCATGVINWFSIISLFFLYLILFVPLFSLFMNNFESLLQCILNIFHFCFNIFCKKEFFDDKETKEELMKVISKTLKKSRYNPKILKDSNLFKNEVRKISKQSKLENFLDKKNNSGESYGRYIDYIDDDILNLYFDSDENINYRLDLIKAIFEANAKKIQEFRSDYFICHIMDVFYQILKLDKIENESIKYINVKLNDKVFEKLYKLGLIETSNKFALSYINIPKIFKFENKYYKITKIGKKFFKDCTNLKQVIIPESVKRIDKYAFKNCKNLKIVSFPINLTKIGVRAFENCFSLSNRDDYFIYLDFLIKLGKYAFRNCKNIKYVSIERLNNIDKGIFENCHSLKNLSFYFKLPQKIEENAFKNCKSLKISVFNFYNIQYIGKKAFYGCKTLEEIEFEHISQIGYKAFAYCSSLTNVKISEDIEEIGDYAFKNCKSLNQIVIPSKIKKIGIGAFQNIDNVIYAGNLDTNNFNSKNVGIDIDVDLNRNILQKLYEQEPFRFKFSDDEINKPFDEIKNKIISVEVPEKFIYEGLSYNIIKLKGAFYNLESLKTVTLPNTITEIGNEAFEACESLTDIVIPDSVTIFGYNVFDFCTKLTNVKLSKNLVEIDKFCFAHCYSLKEIRIPDSVKHIGRGAFLYCTKLEKVKLPKDITKIEANTFSACHLLNDIDIPNSVTEIGDYAFKNCDNSLNFTIPKSVKKLGKDIFAKEYSSYWPMTGYKAIL